MANPVVLKLSHGAVLSDSDRAVLLKATEDVRRLPGRRDIIREGDRPDEVHFVLEGFAFRYKMLPDGRRQILAYLVPGDLCDLHIAILGEMDHGIATAGPCRIAYAGRARIDELTNGHPSLERALRWATLVDEGVLREWLVSMGQRDADRQAAHLFCELLVRLQIVGLADGNSYELPVTQEELGDTLGISTVHVNRTLQSLRDKGWISFARRRLTIHDLEALQQFAGFNPNYLHLDPRRGSGGDGGGRPVR